MQATFSDPQGPRWIRVLLQAPAALLLALGIFGGFSGVHTWVLLALSVITSSTLALISLRQKAPIPARLELGPGRVKVHGTRLRSPVIHAREVTGASTARTKDGFALSLARAWRDAPTTIVVPTEADVDRLRLALGIGHGGHGALAWWTTATANQNSARNGRLVSIVATVLVLAAFAFGAEGDILAKILASMFAFFAIPTGLLLSAIGAQRATYPNVEMLPAGIRLLGVRGPFLLPYAYYDGFVHEGDHLVFKVPEPWRTVEVPVKPSRGGSGMSAADLAILRAQLDAAALRARGYGRSKEEVAGRVETLRRGREATRDWLARLDVIGQTLATGPGYRGQSLDAEDLWMVLEDPDAEADLRTAAARVLRHVEDAKARVRIHAAAAAIRDENVHERVRVAALEPLDEAATSLDEIEERRMRMSFR